MKDICVTKLIRVELDNLLIYCDLQASQKTGAFHTYDIHVSQMCITRLERSYLIVIG